MNSQVKLQGSPDKFPASKRLRAGLLTMEFEHGSLRNICCGEQELIRMIYPAVRDENWLTVVPEISTINLVRRSRSFYIRYESLYRFKDINFKATFTFAGTADSHLAVEMNGLALSTFMKNRIGFCVLHPITSCTGKECAVYHPDGTATISHFPQVISPCQPFRNIRGMQWKIDENFEALLRFEGDIFETEDQRNWTDASFKTYSTPLDIPYPEQITAGTALQQQVDFELKGNRHKAQVTNSGVGFTLGRETAGKLPDVGIGATTRDIPLSRQEGEIIHRMAFSHLRAEVYLFRDDVESQLARLCSESFFTGLPVELCLFFGRNPVAEFSTFLYHYRHTDLQIKCLLLLDAKEQVTPSRLLLSVLPLIRKEIKNVTVGAGTNCNFAQLNRSRPYPGTIDFISFAVHPQEHAFDNRSLMENTEAQGYAVKSALLFEGNRPVFVSPVTLQRRFNANSANFETLVGDGSFPSQVDVRQMSLFGAAWTVRSIRNLLYSGATSLTYYETVGERGIFMGDQDSRWPSQFHAGKCMVFPVFHVFRMLLQHKDYRILNSISSHPLQVDGFVLGNEMHGVAFLSNMTNRDQKVTLDGLTNYRVVFNMHARNFDGIITQDAMPDEVHIAQPYLSNSGQVAFRPYETMVVKFQPYLF